MDPGDVCRVPIAAVHYGKARQTSELGQCWVCRMVLWVLGPRGQCSGKKRFIEKRRLQDERGRHVAKSSSDPRKAYPEVKPQGRDLVQVEGIVVPFAPLEAGTRGNFVLSSPRREMGTEAAVRHGKARQTSDPRPCGNCRRVLLVPGPWGQYSGTIRCIKKRGVQNEVGYHVDKRSSDPRQAYPEVKLQRRELVRVVGIVAPFIPPWAGTRGKFVLSSPRGEIGLGDVCRVPLAAVRHGRAGQTSESGLCGDCRRFCGYWILGVSVRGKFDLSRNVGCKTRGVTKNKSDPRQPYPGQTSGMGPSASYGYCPGRNPMKIRFIEPQGGKWAQETCAKFP